MLKVHWQPVPVANTFSTIIHIRTNQQVKRFAHFNAGIRCSNMVIVRWVRGLVRRVLLNDSRAFLRILGLVDVA